MVIKQTRKTKASQRKQAIVNWKLIGRKVVFMVKEMGTTHAKFLLHTHDRMLAADEAGALIGGGLVPRINRSPSNVTPMVDGSGLLHGNEHQRRAIYHSHPLVPQHILAILASF
jgi:hypothetical protein